MRILVTGATGLVGRALLPALTEQGHQVIALHRADRDGADSAVCWRKVAGLDGIGPNDFRSVDAVVHLAAHVHQMGPTNQRQDQRYFEVNRDQSVLLAESAAAAGVRHLVFISSIKAIGEGEAGHPLKESDFERPEDAYGKSKLDAERALRSRATPIVTVLRFPLVYGPGVKANFAQLTRAVQRGVPLPLGCADAKRSLLGADNAASAILAALQSEPSKHRLYHVADRETPSVRELVQQIGEAFGRPARLWPVPVLMLRLGARLTGRRAMLKRLVEPLRVDCARIEEELGWHAPWSLQQGLQRMARAGVARRTP